MFCDLHDRPPAGTTPGPQAFKLFAARNGAVSRLAGGREPTSARVALTEEGAGQKEGWRSLFGSSCHRERGGGHHPPRRLRGGARRFGDMLLEGRNGTHREGRRRRSRFRALATAGRPAAAAAGRPRGAAAPRGTGGPAAAPRPPGRRQPRSHYQRHRQEHSTELHVVQSTRARSETTHTVVRTDHAPCAIPAAGRRLGETVTPPGEKHPCEPSMGIDLLLGLEPPQRGTVMPENGRTRERPPQWPPWPGLQDIVKHHWKT